MRRRRHVLQVSTFPFLAVLLCAMGSLVLLLFIMDRRAKIAARSRVPTPIVVEEPITKPVVKFVRYDDSRERAAFFRSMDHAKRLRIKLADLKKQIELGRAEIEKLKAQLDANTNALEYETSQLKVKQSAAKKRYQQNVKLAKKVADELQGLSEIQEIVRKLSKKNANQPATYSIVPYFGKNGNQRKPIYMEVAGGNVIVHPQKTAITIMPATFAAVRKEIDREIQSRAGSQKPYLLFLVRPSGIEAYYRAVQVVRSMKVEFGYELIDGEWELDLSPKAMASAVASVDKTGFGPSGAGKGPRLGNGPYPPGGKGKYGRGTLPRPWQGAGPDMQSGRGGGYPHAGKSKGLPKPGGAYPKGGVKPDSVQGVHAKAGTTKTSQNPNGPGDNGTGKKGSQPPKGATAKQGDVKVGTPKACKAKSPSRPTEKNQTASNGSKNTINFGRKPVKRDPPMVRFFGARKFVITVDCLADGVVVYPGGRRFDADSFLKGDARKHPICNEVRNLIHRRQATVPPGETLYRPSILLRVRPEGRRSYFFAYPVLGTLGLPMVQSRSE